ncbi:hypothetical protein ES708_06177 [subsurface metagenome]
MIYDTCGRPIDDNGNIFEASWHRNWRLLYPRCLGEQPMGEWGVIFSWGPNDENDNLTDGQIADKIAHELEGQSEDWL